MYEANSTNIAYKMEFVTRCVHYKHINSLTKLDTLSCYKVKDDQQVITT